MVLVVVVVEMVAVVAMVVVVDVVVVVASPKGTTAVPAAGFHLPPQC